MLEGLVFPVYVGQEMFRAFGQVQNGLQVDDFRACGTDVGDALGEQFQKSDRKSTRLNSSHRN